ncbi:MAG: type II secretion system protein GspD [Planctomycetota bacterium]|jgi:type IV pilus assembly protein PilQ
MYCDKNSKIRKDLLVWGFVLSVIAAIVVGGVGQSPAAAVANEGIEPLGVEVSGGGDPVKPIQTIKFADDTTIRKALQFLGTKYKKNIVPSAKVDGMVTAVTLYDMTFESALNAILGHGYKYEERDGVIWVYTAEEFKKIMEDKDRMVYKVFTLYYISAAEVQKLITPVLSGAGSIQGSTPAQLVVPTGESISVGTGGGDTMALNDTIIIRDYPENIAEVVKLLKELDIRPRQVLVEATILSATLNEGMEFGIDLNLLGGVHLIGSSTTAEVGGANAAALETTITSPIQQIATAGALPGTMAETAGFAAAAGSSGLRIGVRAGDVSAFITALESVTDTTILANPKILAVNKQLGQVYIGTKIGYIDQTTQTQTSTTQSVKFLDTGTKLSFRPYIGNDGYIRMDIHPKDSSGTLKNNDIPDEFSAELATNVMVKDGQTIVIGGLFRDVVVTSRSQIPLLGDLPLIGGLFRGTNDQTQRQEVIVLLTPHIIDEPEETNSDARADDVRRKRFGARDELQWIGRARLAEDRYAMAARYYIENDNESAMRELDIALELRPTYLEAIRLKEKITHETDPTADLNIDRIMLEDFERKDSEKFLRR